MKTYLVGGAVRDQLLGLPVHEKDWVVVGGTAEQLLALGYQQVGKHFPVFLHPETNEEYALARQERKSGKGHTQFEIIANPNTTLEEDLYRRDLTINAIAKGDSGKLIDPYHGIDDLNKQTLRHISDAFIEDPLRVLRVARFHAKLGHLGFTIEPSTLALMKKISQSDELEHLSAERVWQEFAKGLGERSPQLFIHTLYRCHALEILLPELDTCFQHHDNMRDTELKIGERIQSALQHASAQNYNNQVCWAITCHALETHNRPKNLLPKVVPDIDKTQSVVHKLCLRLKVPNDFAHIALLSAFYIDFIIQAKKSKPDTIATLLDKCDAWRKPEQFKALLKVAECLTATDSEQPQRNLSSITFLRQAHSNCLQIKAQAFVEQGLTGEAIGEAMHNARKVAIAELKQQFG